MRRFAYYAGSSPRWCLFWAAWALGFGLFDWYALDGWLRWSFGALMLFLFGLQLTWAGWRAFSPRGREMREWAKGQR